MCKIREMIRKAKSVLESNEDIVLTADDYYATNITVDEMPEQVQETARKRNGSAR